MPALPLYAHAASLFSLPLMLLSSARFLGEAARRRLGGEILAGAGDDCMALAWPPILITSLHTADYSAILARIGHFRLSFFIALILNWRQLIFDAAKPALPMWANSRPISQDARRVGFSTTRP